MLDFSKTNIANVYVEVSTSLNLTKHVNVFMCTHWYMVEMGIVIFLKLLFNTFSNTVSQWSIMQLISAQFFLPQQINF